MATNARVRILGRNRPFVLEPPRRGPSMEQLEPRWLLSAGIALLGEPVGDGPYAISGIVFEDTNANASRDPAEPGLGGWAVQLLDSQGQLLQTVLTDTQQPGAYRFVGLVPGDYQLRELKSSTWVQTLPLAAAYDVSLVDQDLQGLNFGNVQYCTIRGRKFNDVDRDTFQGPGEEGLNGWTIELYPEEGEPIDSQETRTIGSIDGRYMFVDVMPGTYTLAEILRPGWVQTAPLPGDRTVTLTSGQHVTMNFGNVAGTISGLVFHDRDASASLDAEELGLGGRAVQLLNPAGTLLDTVWTDQAGVFAFENLAPGGYQVRQALSSTWVQTYPDEALTHSVTLVDGQHRQHVDFGNVQFCTIRGQKFHDVNFDSIKEGEDEVGLNGWTIELYGEGAEPIDSQETRTIGSEDGRYIFVDVMPGTYRLSEIVQDFWFQTAPSNPSVILTSGQNVTMDFGNAIMYEPIGDDVEAVDDFATVIDPDNATVIDVLANDENLPDPVPDGFITGVTDGLFGTVAIVNNGQAVAYLPGGGPADDSFTYTIMHDGEYSTATVNVDFVNTAHPDQQMHHTQDTLQLDLPQPSAGDAIVYSATVSTPDAYVRRIQQQVALTVYDESWNNWRGNREKWLQDGADNWFFVLPDGTLCDGQTDAPIAQIGQMYYDDPSRIINGLSGEDEAVEPVVAVSVANGKLTVDPPAGFVGVVTVTQTATLGATTVVTQFDVAVTNTIQPPAVDDQTVSTHADTSILPVFPAPAPPLTDADGEPLVYSATVLSPSQAAYDVKAGLHLVSYLPQYDNYSGSVNPEDSLYEKWFLDDAGNWYFIWHNEGVYGVYRPDTELPVGRVSQTYYDNPQLLVDATEPIAPEATVTVVGNVITIDPADGFVGSFDVELRVEDGAGAAVTTFHVEVTNGVPE